MTTGDDKRHDGEQEEIRRQWAQRVQQGEPEEAAALADEQYDYIPGTRIRFVDRGGPLLTGVRIVPIFWGAVWNELAFKGGNGDKAGKPAPAREYLLGFLKALRGTEESAAAHPLALYARAPAKDQAKERAASLLPSAVAEAVPIGDETPLEVSDTEIREYLRLRTEDGRGKDHAANTLYFVFLPPGTTVQLGRFRSCTDFCAYHQVIEAGDARIFYAVVAFPSCLACVRNLSVQDALTVNTSHEFINAVTDPIYGTGWFDPAHNELADVCSRVTVEMPGGYRRRGIWDGERCV